MNDHEEENDERCKYLQGQPQNLTVDQKFRLILRLLRADFPTEYPIKVRRYIDEVLKRSGDKDAPYGWCSLVNDDKPKSERYFLIKINRSVPWRNQFETILHEWAHALTWQRELKQHGDLFARALGTLYRTFIED